MACRQFGFPDGSVATSYGYPIIHVGIHEVSLVAMWQHP